MSLSTDDAVKAAFARSVQEHLQKALRTGKDWDRYLAIKRETDARLMQEQASYKRDKSARIAEAKQIILREENGLRLDQPLPPGSTSHSTSDALQQKAETRVENDHERRLAVIRQDEMQAFTDLSAKIRARDAPTNVRSARQTQFNTRSGPTRIH